ncbi:hypothetical protein ACH4SK_18060 [Streptomyces inhibens]|uniref:hypothetical protein n=1 Tax=Streptomyces inhibens TaxID=2293571 RepID=UPI003792AEE6
MLTATLAFAGVAALINVTPGLDTLRIGGALYLTWLGASALWRSGQRNAHHRRADTGGSAATHVAPPAPPEGPAVRRSAAVWNRSAESPSSASP